MLYLVIPWAFVAIGVAMVLEPGGDSATMGWLTAIFFGICGIIGAVLLIRLRTALTVTSEGLSGYGRTQWSLSWSQIVGVYAARQAAGTTTQDYIVVLSTEPPPTNWLDRSARRFVGAPPDTGFRLASWLVGVQPSIEDALVAVRAAAPDGLPVDDRR